MYAHTLQYGIDGKYCTNMQVPEYSGIVQSSLVQSDYRAIIKHILNVANIIHIYSVGHMYCVISIFSEGEGLRILINEKHITESNFKLKFVYKIIISYVTLVV